MSPVRQLLLSLAVVITLAASFLPASAQTFGKNKVQYEPLEWSVLETPHLSLHYYTQEESLARRIAVVRGEHVRRVRSPLPLPTRSKIPTSCTRRTRCSSRPMRLPR
jgi:hypothetical protein